MKGLILAVVIVVSLIASSDAVETVEDVMYDFAKRSPDVGDVRVSVDTSHIGITIVPSIYATSLDNVFPFLLTGYATCLARMPDYNGYLRIGIKTSSKTMEIYEVPAYKMRAAWETDEYGDLIKDMFANSKVVSYYWSDGLGDITKSASDGTQYGRLSPSTGNWL